MVKHQLKKERKKLQCQQLFFINRQPVLDRTELVMNDYHEHIGIKKYYTIGPYQYIKNKHFYTSIFYSE